MEMRWLSPALIISNANTTAESYENLPFEQQHAVKESMLYQNDILTAISQ
jgi:hypothetical protein